MSTQPIFTLYHHPSHSHLLPQFMQIHIDSTIDDPRTLADFVLPFTAEKRTALENFWTVRLKSTEGPSSTEEIVIAFVEDESGERILAGYVQLHMPVSESGPHVGHVQKLFVGPEFRRRGVARGLMSKLEERARARGRWKVMLSTAKPSPARWVYPKFGFVEYGTVPNLVVNAQTGELMDEIFFYKDLRA